MTSTNPESEAHKREAEKLIAHELRERMNTVYHLSDRIATFAAGILTLTVTFRNDLGGNSVCGLWILRGCWLCLIVSVAGFVLIHLGKIELHRLTAEAVVIPDKRDMILAPWYLRLGVHLLIWCFFFALILLAVFGAFIRFEK